MNAQAQSSPRYEQLALFIDCTFILAEGRHKQEIFNPATGLAFVSLPHASKQDLDHALHAANKAFDSSRSTSPLERSRILRQVAELIRDRVPAIARNIALDQGKPLAEALQEVATCTEHAAYDRFVDAFAGAYGSLRVGDGFSKRCRDFRRLSDTKFISQASAVP